MHHSEFIYILDKLSHFANNLGQERVIRLNDVVEMLMFDGVTIFIIEFHFVNLKKLLR